MELIDKLIAAGPLTIALLALLGVLALGFKLLPYVRKKENEDHSECAKAARVEEISKRVHDNSGRIGDVKRLETRVDALEVHMERNRIESGDLRVQITRLQGSIETHNSKLEDLCERIDRNDEVMGGRIGRLEEKIDDLQRSLLGRATGS